MVAWRDMAASAYRAYAANLENRTTSGVALVPWNWLPANQQTAWEAAVRQAIEVSQGGSYGLDIETKWTGWKSPSFVPTQKGSLPPTIDEPKKGKV